MRKALIPGLKKYDPYDIHSVFHPVDFVVFDGLNKGVMKDIAFLARKNPPMSKIHASVKTCIKAKAYDWMVARIQHDGTLELK